MDISRAKGYGRIIFTTLVCRLFSRSSKQRIVSLESSLLGHILVDFDVSCDVALNHRLDDFSLIEPVEKYHILYGGKDEGTTTPLVRLYPAIADKVVLDTLGTVYPINFTIYLLVYFFIGAFFVWQ